MQRQPQKDIELLEFPKVMPNSEHGRLLVTIKKLLEDMGYTAELPDIVSESLSRAKKIHQGLFYVHQRETSRGDYVKLSHYEGVMDCIMQYSDRADHLATLMPSVYHSLGIDEVRLSKIFLVCILQFPEIAKEILNLRNDCWYYQYADTVSAALIALEKRIKDVRFYALLLKLYVESGGLEKRRFHVEGLVSDLVQLHNHQLPATFIPAVFKYILSRAKQPPLYFAADALRTPDFMLALHKLNQFCSAVSLPCRDIVLGGMKEWPTYHPRSGRPDPSIAVMDIAMALDERKCLPENYYSEIFAGWMRRCLYSRAPVDTVLIAQQQEQLITGFTQLHVEESLEFCSKELFIIFEKMNYRDIDHIINCFSALYKLNTYAAEIEAILKPIMQLCELQDYDDVSIFDLIRNNIRFANEKKLSDETCVNILKTFAKAYDGYNGDMLTKMFVGVATLEAQQIPPAYYARIYRQPYLANNIEKITAAINQFYAEKIPETYYRILFLLVKDVPFTDAADRNRLIDLHAVNILNLAKSDIPENLRERIIAIAYGGDENFMSHAITVCKTLGKDLGAIDYIFRCLTESKFPARLVQGLTFIPKEQRNNLVVIQAEFAKLETPVQAVSEYLNKLGTFAPAEIKLDNDLLSSAQPRPAAP